MSTIKPFQMLIDPSIESITINKNVKGENINGVASSIRMLKEMAYITGRTVEKNEAL